VKVSDVYPSKYLRGADLAGHVVSVRIEHILMEPFFNQETKETEKKPVLYFAGKSKGLILSKSLAFRIAEILGSEDMESWHGKEIVILTEQRSVFGTVKSVFTARAKEQPAAEPGQ
jgi:hypothetical protein